MEENNIKKKPKKSGKGKIFIIIILLQTVLCLSGYIVYDKYINEEKETPKEETVKTETEEQNFNLANKTMIQALNGKDYYTLYISKEGQAFLTVDSYDDSEQSIKNSIAKLQEKYTDNTINGYCKAEGDIKNDVCPTGDVIKSIKLDIDNIVSAYDVSMGQDVGGWRIIFVKADGTIASLNIGEAIYGEDMKIDDNIGDFKNIVTVVQSLSTGIPSGYYDAYAIEKNGTQHSLIEALYKNKETE